MDGTLKLTCLRPGGGAFLVDGGRPGQRAAGIAGGGAADPYAHATANRLLDQTATTASLELTLTGGQWLLSGQGQFALAGAEMGWQLNGSLLDGYTVHHLAGDALLTGKMASRGLRAYLAIKGEWTAPKALGSAEVGFPGIPQIIAGWSTTVNWSSEAIYRTEFPPPQLLPADPYTLRVAPGPEWGWLTAAEQRLVLKTPLRIGTDSSRQGIRLRGLSGTIRLPSLISSPVLPGTVQLAPAGPILLGPDAQTIGGYPRILLVTDTKNLAAAFQVRLGGEVRFALEGE